LTSGVFRIVSDTLVLVCYTCIYSACKFSNDIESEAPYWKSTNVCISGEVYG